MRDMATAPQDGTRILVKTQVYHYSRDMHNLKHTGEQWIEARWKDGEWKEWCGDDQTNTTGKLYPIGWMPSPDNGYTMVPVELTDNVAEAIAIEAGCCGGIALDIWDAAIKVARHET